MIALSQRHFACPSGVKSLCDYGLVYPRDFSPLRNAALLAIVKYHYVISAISRVYFSAGPSAIFLAVVSVIIDPVYLRIFGWPHAHVFDESNQRHPLFAERNSTTAVAVESNMSRIKTALFYVVPNVVLRRLAKSVSAFGAPAAATLARFWCSLSNHIGRAPVLCATGAATHPVASADVVEEGPGPKGLAGAVYSLGHVVEHTHTCVSSKGGLVAAQVR